MPDDNWELLNGPDAHHIERLNAASTLNVLEALVTFLIAHQQSDIPHMPNEAALKELHRSSTLFLLRQPGEYRNGPVNLIKQGVVVYEPPPHEEVQEHMDRFFDELAKIWVSGDAIDAAAFALWRINWIHPFRNGNGRTARSFAYACLCAKYKMILPGTITVIDQIMESRETYELVLRDGDKKNLKPMKAYLERLLMRQLSTIAPEGAP